MNVEPPDSKEGGYQLRVRINSEEKKALDRMMVDRNKNETMSDIVRMALSHLIKREEMIPSYKLGKKIKTLAALLKRDPNQVEKACIEGIFDLIENKAQVPLIVMESQLHLSYGSLQVSPTSAEL